MRLRELYEQYHDQTVVYNPGIGPFGFNPDYLEPVIECYLSKAHEGELA